MNEVIKIFMERDRLTKKEAVHLYKEMREDILEILRVSGSYDEVEDYLLAEGLEMDYIFCFI